VTCWRHLIGTHWSLGVRNKIATPQEARRLPPHSIKDELILLGYWACSDGMARRRSDGVLLGIADTEVR
jgi:hypothetical protein